MIKKKKKNLITLSPRTTEWCVMDKSFAGHILKS